MNVRSWLPWPSVAILTTLAFLLVCVGVVVWQFVDPHGHPVIIGLWAVANAAIAGLLAIRLWREG
jgi:predicted small integral membrane protein